MTVSVSGVNEVARAFKELDKALAKKICQKAIKASLPPVKAAAMSAAPRKSGALASAIAIRAMKRSMKGFGQNVVWDKKRFPDEYYITYQELGWKTGKRGSANRRQIPGKHFMQKAMKANKEMAKRTAIAQIRQGIRDQLRK